MGWPRIQFCELGILKMQGGCWQVNNSLYIANCNTIFYPKIRSQDIYTEYIHRIYTQDVPKYTNVLTKLS